jgi:potassium efflux system protein
MGFAVYAQTAPVATPMAAASPAPATSVPAPTSAAIPLPEIVSQLESANGTLRAVAADLVSDQITASVADELPALTREIGARLEENARILAATPSLDTLRSMSSDWRQQRASVSGWTRDLTSRAAHLDRQTTDLTGMNRTWTQTLTLAGSSDAPAAIVERIRATLAQIGKTQERVEAERANVLGLQNRVIEQQVRVDNAVSAIQQARDEAVNRLFQQDSPPIWTAIAQLVVRRNFLLESNNSIGAQLTGIGAYAVRRSARFLLHALVLALFVWALFRLQRKVADLTDAEPDLGRGARVVGAPIATGIVLSLFTCGWIYPDAPRLLWAILGALALLPTIVILRRLVERHLFPILNALVVFYLVDQVRSVAASLPIASRLLFLSEMIGGACFLTWLIRTQSLAGVPVEDRDRLWKAMRVGARIGLTVFMAAGIANLIGFVSLASVAGDAVLRSAYMAIVLYAVVRIADGLILIALRIRPLSLLGIVRRHRERLALLIHRGLVWAAFALWMVRTLDLLALLTVANSVVHTVLNTPLNVGTFSLTLGHLIGFVITVWASLLISRFLRFVLEEDVYPRIDLPRGLPYAISTMVNYVILLIGFFMSVAAMGIDMTRFTILAGAFGVGLGFGLQNIFNNFVSGLILLFERPVKVGDVIQIGDATGVVQNIGIRASIIRTTSGSEVIVPNGSLISEKVTNWTFSNNQRNVVVPVTVAAGTEPQKVMDLLKRVALENERVVKEPAPQALLVKFGPASLDFELHAWTERVDLWEQTRSELAIEINSALLKEAIPTVAA